MKVTAIIPVYNGKKYLREAIDSVINQTLKPIELIIIDDGSSDGSIDILKNITSPFNISVITQKNAGQAAARNRGITAAQGDFIALLDQDDAWYPNHLEVLAKEFDGNELLGWSYSNVDECDQRGRLLKKGLLNYIIADHPKIDVERMLSEDLHILPSATLIRKKALFEIGLFDERFSGYEDDDLFVRLFLAGWDNTYIKKSLSKWRVHANSSGHTLRMHESRRLFAQKMLTLFQDMEMNRFSPSEVIGKRFFDLYLKSYKLAMLQGDYKKCHFFLPELKHYLSMLNKPIQKKWQKKVFFFKYPRITHAIYKLACEKN
jgi:glycosyltransferase involved in cell wall biosynthesis